MQDYRLEKPKRPSISSLISGIFRDASDLISKEIMAARLEMREEMANAKSTAVLIGLGAACLLLGSILLAFTVVYLLDEYTELPVWACYGIVGAALSVIGFAVLFAGKRRAGKTNLVPTTTIENAKEDARWITRSVKYDTR
jgi:Putative Actinobacterial Holin-X, holin superfamily III